MQHPGRRVLLLRKRTRRGQGCPGTGGRAAVACRAAPPGRKKPGGIEYGWYMGAAPAWDGSCRYWRGIYRRGESCLRRREKKNGMLHTEGYCRSRRSKEGEGIRMRRSPVFLSLYL